MTHIKTISSIEVIGARFDTEDAERTPAAAGIQVAAVALDRFIATIVLPPVELPLFDVAKAASAPASSTELQQVEVLAPNLPTDSLFANQWHLRNQTPGELDLRLFDGNTSVWDEFTGNGVLVGIIDDGIDSGHQDLNDNYNATLETVTGEHQHVNDAHGTAVAGIIAAEQNGEGVVGIAYNSQFTMMGAISGAANITIAQSIANSVNFDVINNSWGYTNPWYDTFFNSAQSAVYTGILDLLTNGRSGLGTVFVKSSGNGRDDYAVAGDTTPNDNANFSFLTSHWGSIAVAAVNRDGTVTTYSTEGSSVLVSAFGSPIPGEVLTTDRRGGDGYNAGDYFSGFNGTSSAAPMVTSIVALMLEANPDLGYRDVQEILAMTARHVGTSVGGGATGNERYGWDWNGSDSWNGGGQHFSEDYGYGLVDALAAVRLAESWTEQNTLGNLTYVEAFDSATQAITDHSTISISFTLAAGVTAEHVVIDLGISHTYAADLVVRLVSPDGTESYLLKSNGLTQGIPNYTSGYDISLQSSMFRGEDSGGTWTLYIQDVAGGDTGQYDMANLYVQGSASTDDTYVFTNEYSDYVTAPRQSVSEGDGGRDVVNASAVSSGSRIDLGGGGSQIDGVAVTFSGSIEEASGGDGNDTLIGSSGANTLNGWRGNDLLKGGGSADTLDGGRGHDGADYSDKVTKVEVALNGATAVNMLVNGAIEDSIRNIEDLIGGAAGDQLTGDALANSFTGNAGDDTFKGSGGSDTLDGGANIDTADYSDKAGKVTVTLNQSTAANVTVAGVIEDSIKNVENVISGSAADKLTGDALANSFTGNDGNDTLKGAAGNDTFKGGLGKDVIDGGTNVDTADYSDKTSKVVVTLNKGTAVNVTVAGAVEDSIKNVENVIGGSASDTLTGDALANVFTGGGGKDTIKGGGGSDKFVFNSQLRSSNVDKITDFTHDADKICIDDAIFGAVGTLLGKGKFYAAAGATKAHDSSDRIVYDKTTGKLYFDDDGNKSGGHAAIHFATLSTKPTLDHGDFAIV